MSFFKNSFYAAFSSAALLTLLLPGSGLAQNGPVIQESAPATNPAPATPTVAPSSEANPPPSTPVVPKAPTTPRPPTSVSADPRPASSTVSTPIAPAAPKLVNLAPPANRFGDGINYLGHRFYEEKGGGWGWIKKEGDSWSSAKWVTLKEDPIRGLLMPSRKMGSRSADQDYEYRMTGRFSEKTAYDPHLDEYLPIFIIESYQSLGPVKPLTLKPGPPERFTRARKSRSSSREDRPVINAPDSDSF